MRKRTPMHNLMLITVLVLAALFSQDGLKEFFTTGKTGQTPIDNSQSVDLRQQELEHTLALIQRGGPYPYEQDDGTFFNRERHLPEKPRGYYREYTVKTPGERTRGARRIVAGGQPPEVYYYTEDHYRSFRRIETN